MMFNSLYELCQAGPTLTAEDVELLRTFVPQPNTLVWAVVMALQAMERYEPR